MFADKISTTYSEYFHSINKPRSNPKQLKLCISYYKDDSIEVELVNQYYKQQRTSKLNLVLVLLCCYVGYRTSLATATTSGIMPSIKWTKTLAVDATFLLCLLSLLHSTTQLIQSEKLLFCLDFAIQLQTQRFLTRRSSVFIPSELIYDICINEVIEDLDVHYLLIVRTKGPLFSKRPIIPVFNTLKPSIDCLEMAYKQINNIMNKKRLNVKNIP